MPVKDPDVAFVISGGTTNENPNLSLGSDISTATGRNIRDNFLHNLFDEVINTEAVSGEYEYRHFYFRNRKDYKVKNVRFFVIGDQTSIWSKVEFARTAFPFPRHRDEVRRLLTPHLNYSELQILAPVNVYYDL